MIKRMIIFCLFCLSLLSLSSQETNQIPYKLVNGDTVLIDNIKEVVIIPERKFSNEREYLNYRRLIRDIKKVYPYSKIANEILLEVNAHYLELKSDNERTKFVKQVEERLRTEFEEELKQFTIRQGRVLIKLIDRETGSTTFDIVKELRGSFSAFLWQTIAKLFGSDLKTKYDPMGEDRMMEEIIILIENGQL